MIVMKFGGTSVGSAEGIKRIKEAVSAQIGRKPIVVCSALEGVTNLLIEYAKSASTEGDSLAILEKIEQKHKKMLSELGLPDFLMNDSIEELKSSANSIKKGEQADAKMMDKIVSFGERMSVKIIAAHLTNSGIKAIAIPAYDVGMVTNSNFGSAEPTEEAETRIKDSLNIIQEIPIITGFIGKDQNGDITTLGRGGSDYTATIIGAAMNAEEIQVWKDVDGVMTADPRVVKNARMIENISFQEASELAFFGSKILHPTAIIPALRKNIPIKVLNTYNPSSLGTTISSFGIKTEQGDNYVRAISWKEVFLIEVSSPILLKENGLNNMLTALFSTFSKWNIPIDTIATSKLCISFVSDKDINLDNCINDIKKIGETNVKTGKSIVCVIGEGMKGVPGIAGKIFTTVKDTGVSVDMISQGASEINVTFIIDSEKVPQVVNALHEKFIEHKS